MFRKVIATASLFALSCVGATAQDVSLGQEIFMDRCAVCHGEAGAGDGMVAELFDANEKPDDLTQIAKMNDGVFPFDDVVQAVDGRREIRAHGYSRMPIWGEYFMEDALADTSVNPKNAKEITQGRILAIAYYLQTIQSE